MARLLKMAKRIYLFFLLITGLIYLSIVVSPNQILLAGFGSFIIPFLLVGHLVGFLLCLFIAKRYRIYGLFGLVVGLPFYYITIGMHFQEPEKNDLSVLSYNVRVFNVYKHLNTDFISSKKMIAWVKEDDSSIKCLQEFHNQNESHIFNTKEQLTNNGEYEVFISPFNSNKRGHDFGLAIFSLHPIINKGKVNFSATNQNSHAIFVDVIVDLDTIRIYNAHLESMSINQNVLFNTEEIDKGIDHLYEKLSYGTRTRAIQVDELVQHMTDSPHPIILCCDLNEIPYSYVYHRIKGMLKNSFEDQGTGFGFSFNGKLPFLRIDNQFYNSPLKTSSFETIRKVDYSDHFPIKVHYRK